MFYISLGAALAVTIYVWVTLARVFRMFRITLPAMSPDTVETLPTVSLCIPARDETHAMTSCLESALRASYPKLEIIVLDDGSRDNTGHLIKSFAHSGIRFVEGSALPTGWLGKNHALQGLLKESSGSYILFADVDTHFSVDSINQIVAYALQKNASMVSVLPYRENTLRPSAMFATFRHFWSMIGHSRKSPAVASNAWLVKREVIENEFHGFEAIKTAVRPEKHIAMALAARNEYRFVISGRSLGVSYEKKLSSQYETSIRIYYPDFGLRGVVLRSVGLFILLVPYLLVIAGLIAGDYITALAAGVVTIVISVLNAWYLGVLRSNNYGIASVCLPFIIIREIILLLSSVVMYRTNKVNWKGRPVSIR